MDGALPACSAQLGRESDYLCVTNTHRGQKCEGVACFFGVFLQEGESEPTRAKEGLPTSAFESRSSESNAAGQSPASKHPSHSVTFHYHRVILIT